MLETVQVFYHIRTPERQQILVDPGDIQKNKSFPKLQKKWVPITDLRTQETPPCFEKDSFEYFHLPTHVQSFKTEEGIENYNAEVTAFLKERLQAREVMIFEHTFRREEPPGRPPARHVHSDYSKKSSDEMIQRHLPLEKHREWLQGHYAVLNIWRPLQNRVHSVPMGLIHPASVHTDDLVEMDFVFPGRTSELFGVTHNPKHHWVYLSEMTPQEILLFNIYDNQGQASVMHSAFDFATPHPTAIRASLESRILVLY